jgi:hypothetical protein
MRMTQLRELTMRLFTLPFVAVLTTAAFILALLGLLVMYHESMGADDRTLFGYVLLLALGAFASAAVWMRRVDRREAIARAS